MVYRENQVCIERLIWCVWYHLEDYSISSIEMMSQLIAIYIKIYFKIFDFIYLMCYLIDLTLN